MPIDAAPATQDVAPHSDASAGTLVLRLFAWGMLALLIAFIANNFLTHWLGMPGAWAVFAGDTAPLGLAQLAFSIVLVGLAVWRVFSDTSVSLRSDSVRITGYNAFLVRAAFWAVVLVGVADLAISFLRVEDMLDGMLGHELGSALGRSQFRGPYIHIPLIVVGIVMACFTRTLGFTWLALLVVLAEMLIVVGRYIFSYEQAFMADLVRFWYAALFLFASAYTLLEDGHVRVDVFYAGFRDRTKGYVNAIGSVLLGMTLCWAILLIGLWGPSNIINSPMLSFEVTQSGFGLYVKYLMAAFIGIFAISMLIQFTSYLLESVADIRGEPGKREIQSDIAH